jgi:hypothetical protein
MVRRPRFEDSTSDQVQRRSATYPIEAEYAIHAFVGIWRSVRYVNGRARTISIVFCGEVLWLLFIGIVHIHSGVSKGYLALIASLVLVIAIRSGISFVLILEPDRLTTRTLTRTRSWTYSELQSAEGVSGPKKMGNRSIIVLRPKIGEPYVFKALGEVSDSTSFTHPAVRQINARILCSSSSSSSQ